MTLQDANNLPNREKQDFLELGDARMALVDIFFQRMPMGIAILDRKYRIQRYNPTWEDFAARYAPPSGVQLAPGVNYFDHLPGSEAVVIPLFERALQGETVRQNSVRLESEGIVTFWDIVLAPIVENGETVGILNIAVDATERVEALQNLEQRVAERTRELTTLLQVSRDITATLEFSNLVEIVLDQLKTVVDYTGASVLILEENELVVQAYRGPIPRETARHLRFPLAEALVNREVLRQRQPLIIADIYDDLPVSQMFRQSAKDQLDSTFGYVRSWLGVPLIVKGSMLGMLTLDHNQPNFFAERQADLVQTFANQVAVALENAHLFEQAAEAAIAAERNRLARDLHDAVTQTLFSASIIADVLPKIWVRNPEEGSRRLEELRQLTRGALSEMRTLLLELRPAALEDTDLSDLIGHQINAFTARTRIPVNFECNLFQNPPPEIKEMFYRVAQEAFNNIAKHADATSVSVQLTSGIGGTELVIEDDGIGFDRDAAKNEGLGLGIMAERVQNVSARLDVDSQVGAGTRLTITWQESNEENHND